MDIRSVDYESGLLAALLENLEAQLNRAWDNAVTTDVWLDDYSFITGVALVACQHYITSACGWMGISKRKVLTVGPKLTVKLAYAEAINAAADYWKHSDAWNDPAEVKRSRNTRRVIALMVLIQMMFILPMTFSESLKSA